MSKSRGKPTYVLETRRIVDLKVDQGYREEQGDIEELSESIKEKGLLQPITVTPDGRVLAGRRRVAACLEADLSEVPVLVKQTSGELDEREIELFENIHRKDLTWQEQMRLTARIHDLLVEKHEGNWSQSRTAQLMGKSRSAVTDAVEMAKAMEIAPTLAEAPTADKARRQYKRLIEDAVVSEAMKEVESKKDSISIIARASSNYKVADALESMANLREGIAHFAEVDPPYGIDLKAYREAIGSDAGTYNEVDVSDYPKFLDTTAKQVYRCLSDDAFCVWWYGPTWHQTVLTTLREAGFHVDDIPAIWTKPGTASPAANPEVYLNRGYEPFFICRKGRPVLRKRGRSNVFDYPSPRGNRVHPTERPVELIVDILETFVYPGASVLVPFLGSGNTLIAVYRCKLLGWGYELSTEYRNAFLKRVSEEFPDEEAETE